MAENIINEDRIKLNKYNEHITSLEDLLKSVTIKGNYEQFRLAPCFLLFSFIDLLRGVAILDNNHMVVAGNIIVRSMFELLIDFLYCETDRKNLYLRFGEYQDINRVLLYNSVSSDIQEKVDKDKYENVTLKNYNLFLEKYNINPKDKRKLSNWCGLSIKERVDNVSETVPEIYNLYLNIYKINCVYTHTDAGTICEYAEHINEGIDLNYQRKYNKDKFLLIKEINSIVEIFYNRFKDTYANNSLEEITF